MSKQQAKGLLKVLIISALPQIRSSQSPQIAYETVIELCFLLFRAGLGSRKCIEYRISRGHIINRFEEYSECQAENSTVKNEIADYLQTVVFQKKHVS